MSGPFRVYRSNVNLPRMPNGSLHEIDDTDGRWADYIAAGWITPVGPPRGWESKTTWEFDEHQPVGSEPGTDQIGDLIDPPDPTWVAADPQPPNPPTIADEDENQEVVD